MVSNDIQAVRLLDDEPPLYNFGKDGVFDEASRKPTDRYWLIPFIIAIIAFIVVAILSETSGGVANHNENGPTCGFDSNVLDNDKILYLDERQCMKKSDTARKCDAPWICVKTCPKGVFDASSCTTANISTLKGLIVCQSDTIRNGINNCDDLEKAVRSQHCVSWYKESKDAFGYCHSSEVTDTDSTIDADDKAFIEKIVTKATPRFLVAIAIAIFVSFFFITTLKQSAAFVFWGFVIVVTLAHIGVVIGLAFGLSTDESENFVWFFIFTIISFFVFLIFLCVFRRKIPYGIEIVKESSRAVTCSYSSIFFPIMPFILRAIIGLTLAFSFVMAMQIYNNYYTVHGSLSSSDCICNNGGYSEGASCMPEQFNKDCHTGTGEICQVAICKLDNQMESSTSTIYIAVLVFTGMWIVAFLQANTKMILAHIYGNWYWNWNQEFIPSGAVSTATGKVLGNHTGTAALGSLIITICRIIKALLSASKSRTNNRSAIGLIIRIIGEIIRACAQGLLDIIEFISDKAFVVCAIMGTDFWDSVKGVSNIMVKDIPLVIATKYVGNIILFSCKFVAAIVSAGVFYCITPFSVEDNWITLTFVVITFILAYDLASVLLTSYHVAVYTLLICGLQDFKQSKKEKQYYKSAILNGLLVKKEVV